VRNNKLQEKEKYDQAAYFAKTIKSDPCPAKQKLKKLTELPQ